MDRKNNNQRHGSANRSTSVTKRNNEPAPRAQPLEGDEAAAAAAKVKTKQNKNVFNYMKSTRE